VKGARALPALLALGVGAFYSPRVASVFPAGAQRGSEVEIALRGERLDEPQGLLGDTDGIEVLQVAGDKPERCTLRLRLAPDCALGARLLRLRTSEGLSNPFQFRVGPLPESAVTPGDAPLPLELDRTVDAELAPGGVHRYLVTVPAGAVEGPAGARVRCEVEALRLGQRAVDLALEVRGPDGAVVASCDDDAFATKDPLLAFEAAQPGDYTIAVRGAYAGDMDRGVYRLHIGTFPRPLAAMPCGGAPGATLQLQLLGDGPPVVVTTTLPATTDLAVPCWPQVDGRTVPTPLWLRVGGPASREPTTDDKGRAFVQFPGAVHGVLAMPGASATFFFHAEKDSELLFRALARTLRSPLDPLLVVRDAGGRYLASNDDQNGLGLDSQLRFKAEAAGDFQIEVRDLLRQGSPRHAFRLEADRPAPDPTSARMILGRRDDAAVEVPQGAAMGCTLQLANADPEQGLSMFARELPPGVTATFGPVQRGTNLVPVLLAAEASAPLGGAMVSLGMHATKEPLERDAGFAQELPLVTVRNDQPIVRAVQRTLPVAVTKTAPLAVELTAPRVPIVRGAPLPLHVRITRAEGNKDRIRVRALWSPPGLNAGQCVLEGDKTEGDLPLSADGGAMLGTFPFAVVATDFRRGSRVEVASAFVQLTVEPAWIEATAAAVRTEQGKPVEVRFQLASKHALADKWQARLLSLPKGVTAEPLELPADAKEAVFVLKVAADAPEGRHRNWQFEASVPGDGGTVTCRAGAPELRIDAPLPSTNGGASGSAEGGR
jgi:hypothetical protein